MAAPVQVDADKQSNTATATSIVITKPTNLADDDILYACIARDEADGTDAITAPSGWTVLDSAEVDNGTFTCGIYRKVIVTASSEPSDYTWSWTNSEKVGGWIARITGADTTTPEDVTPSNNTGTASLAPRALSVSTVTADTLLLACVGMSAKQAANYTAPSGMAEFFDFPTTGGGAATVHASSGAAEENRAATGATGDRDFASIDNNDYVAFLIAIRPAAGGANRNLTPGVVALTIASPDPTVNATRELSPGVRAFSIASPDPVVQRVREITATLQALNIASQNPVVNRSRELVPGVVALNIQGFNPTVAFGKNLTPGVVALNIAAQNPVVNTTREIAPALATLNIASSNATVQRVREIVALLVVLNIQEFNPTVELTGGGGPSLLPKSGQRLYDLMYLLD